MWYAKEFEEIYKKLKTSQDGLTGKEVEKRKNNLDLIYCRKVRAMDY